MEKLIIAEKPSVAVRLALALGESRPQRQIVNGVSYYIVNNKGDTLYVVAAAGHLFSLHQKDQQNTLPIFSVEWLPSYKVNKASYFTKKYLDVIEEVGKRCKFFINACDYDVEGTVIGSNILKQVINHDVNMELGPESIKRMKFSTTTLKDLASAYAGLQPFDIENLNAGEARHILDWIWGINLSRALMHSLASGGTKRILSIGRVQGPTLAVLAKREREISAFIPTPFWKLFVSCEGVEFENKKGNIEDEKTAEAALKATQEGSATVKSHSRNEEAQYPFPPFDLTSLQLEASRVFGLDPSRTLAIAQTLYEHAYISYPRTSSQKLPYTLNLKGIINALARNPKYGESASLLMAASRFRPHEGQKADEAHPAIHPTGEQPKGIDGEEEKTYDLITRRFLACFAEEALLEKSEITLSIGGEEYSARGGIVKRQGWLQHYTYYKPKELRLPDLKEGEGAEIEKAYIKKGMTEPPKRYSKATLISLLEKKNLGTKATRAAIIDTLFKRGYIKNSRMEVTEFGMGVYEVFNKYCNDILDEKLTSELETDMERITRRELSKEKVVDEGRAIISTAIKRFSEHNAEIGRELAERLKESEKANILGRCKCGGDLVIKVSRARKSYVGCTNWPNCNVTYPLPQYAKIVPMHKVCELCRTPMVKVFRKGKVFQMDLDPNCETKKEWKSASGEKGARQAAAQGSSPAMAPAPKPMEKKSEALGNPDAPSPAAHKEAFEAASPPVTRAKEKKPRKAKKSRAKKATTKKAK